MVYVLYHLFHSNRNCSYVSRKTVNVNFEKDICVEGCHVNGKVEEDPKEGHRGVDQCEEGQHFHLAPERLNQLAAQPNRDNINTDLPEVKLYKAMRKDGPDSETRRKDIAWCDSKEKNGRIIV
jgi:hypothetical protein